MKTKEQIAKDVADEIMGSVEVVGYRAIAEQAATKAAERYETVLRDLVTSFKQSDGSTFYRVLAQAEEMIK